jgi:nucleoside-diphosphate-sugar epimerase
MRVFVTGATGFIGTAVVADLLAAGHQVLGLTRSAEGATALEAAGATAHHGSLEDVESICAGAREADGVIHLAFNHDFSRFAQNCADDHRVVEALGATLAGLNRPLIVTSGTAMVNPPPGQMATEDGPVITSADMPRAASEEAALAAATKGVNTAIMRLPQVHDPRRQGLITYAIAVAKDKGVSAYIGDGGNRWPAAHLGDVARIYRLALERATPGAIYHAVDEEGVSMRAIAQVLGERLGLPVASVTPEEAEAHFGWLAHFAMRDLPASSVWTRQTLGWHPTGPGMIADLEQLVL